MNWEPVLSISNNNTKGLSYKIDLGYKELPIKRFLVFYRKCLNRAKKEYF